MGYQTEKFTPAAGRTLAFKPGRGYYSKPGQSRGATAPTDPLAPLSGAQIANQIAGYTAGLPKPLTDQQIQQRAQQTIDPLIASLTSQAQARGKAAAGAISGYADSIAGKLGQYGDSAAKIYGGAEQSQAASDAALSGALKTGGNGLADALSAKLGAIGGDTGGLVDATRQAGVGGGNALLANGSASLANLLSRGTAAQDEAAKQPGIALRQGQYDINNATLANNKNLSDSLTQVTDQLPSIVGSLRSASDTRATNIASTRNSASQFYQSRNDAINAGRAKNDTALTTAKIKADTTAQTAAAKQANTDRSYSLAYARTFGVDPKTGQPTLAAVKAAQSAETKANKKTAGLTPATYARLKEKASEAADTFYYGVNPKQHYDATTKAYSDVPGTGVPGVDYQTAVRRIQEKFSLKPDDAIKLANEYYAPGERGRPEAPLPKPKRDTGFRQVKIPKGK